MAAWLVVLAATSVGLLALAGCGGSSTATVTVTTPAKPTVTVTKPAKTASTPLGLPALVAKVRSGVVRIETTTCAGGEIGTGILITPRLVATVDHVVDGALSIALKQNGEVVGYGTVIGSDVTRDVALIRTDRPISGYHFRFATQPPELGQNVAAIGFPLGLPLTVTNGTISGGDRTIQINGINRTQLIQTDVPVNPGNSGGPLMTNSGLVVGLIDLRISQANGLAFAVSARVAAPLIQGWTVAPQSAASSSCSAPAAKAAPTSQTQTSATAAQPYTGKDFSIEYPPGWVVSHLTEGGGNLDTTFAPANGGGLVIRVDENPNAGNMTPAAGAAPVIASLTSQPGYVDLGETRGAFDGYPSLSWEFEDVENGVELHKVDEFITEPNGHGWGVLIQAPQSDWARDADALESYLATLSVS